MSGILSAKIPAFYRTSKTLTFGGTSNIDFFDIGKNFNSNGLTYSKRFVFTKAKFT